jgi:hypothetical protein
VLNKWTSRLSRKVRIAVVAGIAAASCGAGVSFAAYAGAGHQAVAGLIIIHSNSEFCGMVDTEGDGITLVNIGPGGCPDV